MSWILRFKRNENVLTPPSEWEISPPLRPFAPLMWWFTHASDGEHGEAGVNSWRQLGASLTFYRLLIQHFSEFSVILESHGG